MSTEGTLPGLCCEQPPLGEPHRKHSPASVTSFLLPETTRNNFSGSSVSCTFSMKNWQSQRKAKISTSQRLNQLVTRKFCLLSGIFQQVVPSITHRSEKTPEFRTPKPLEGRELSLCFFKTLNNQCPPALHFLSPSLTKAMKLSPLWLPVRQQIDILCLREKI